MAKKKHLAADALKIVIETVGPLETNEKQWVLQSAASLWSFGVQALPVPGAPTPAPAPGVPTPAAPGAVEDAKAFMRAKKPTSDLQRIVVLAYHLTNGKGMPSFKTPDLTTANTAAKGTAFNTKQAVDNASRPQVGFLSAVGGGKKQITAHGEEIVDALPNQEAVAAVEAKYKQAKRGGKATKRKGKTA